MKPFSARELRALQWLDFHGGVASISSPEIRRCPDFVRHRLMDFVNAGWMVLRPHWGGVQVYEMTTAGYGILHEIDAANLEQAKIDRAASRVSDALDRSRNCE